MPNKKRVKIGRIKDAIFKKEWLTVSEMNHHVHVVGASGFGKTVLLTHILENRIRNGEGCLFVDLKCDIEMIATIRRIAEDVSREQSLRIFSITDIAASSSYNLLSDGTATELRDRVMASFVWSEEFYKNQAASFLLKLLMGLVWLREHKSFSIHLGVLAQAVTEKHFIDELCLLIPDTELKVKNALEGLTRFVADSGNWNSLQGLRSQLESLMLSEFSELIGSEKSEISLFEAVRKKEIVIVTLDSRRYGETARTLGRFILQDLKAVSARVDAEVRKSDRQPFAVIIDEFADFAQDDFIGFLDRARSSRMSIVVAHQEIADLKRISPEFAARLMGNTSTLYAFLQKGPESAETIAKVAGTKQVWKDTFQIEKTWFFPHQTGRGSRREVEEFVIHPNVIKSLKVGECICIKKYPTSRAYRVAVFPGA